MELFLVGRHVINFLIIDVLNLYQRSSKKSFSNPKLFADDTSLFSVVRDMNTSANKLMTT